MFEMFFPDKYVASTYVIDFEQLYKKGYRGLIEKSVLPNIEKGLSAVIYTQLSDVEEEVNGILTYDRKFLKLDVDTVRDLNQKQMLTDI